MQPRTQGSRIRVALLLKRKTPGGIKYYDVIQGRSKIYNENC